MSEGGIPTQCVTCSRFESPLDGGLDRRCTAFTGDIPDVIWTNKFDHRKPYPGDHGQQWKSDGVPYPAWVLHTASDA